MKMQRNYDYKVFIALGKDIDDFGQKTYYNTATKINSVGGIICGTPPYTDASGGSWSGLIPDNPELYPDSQVFRTVPLLLLPYIKGN